MKISVINFLDYPTLNTGLTYVITAIDKSRHRPRLIDVSFCNKNYIEYVIRKIKDYSPETVGFSTMSPHYQKNIEIAKEIKAKYPHIFTIFGGIHPTLLPEETLNNPYVDAVCIGEGERAIVELLDCLEEKKEPKVKGIWYKKDGRIIKNELRMWEEDLDSLPFPDWDFWDMERYFREQPMAEGALTISTSRGCLFDCSFCSNKALSEKIPGKYFRTRSAKNIIDEIKNNKQKYKNFKFLYITDDTFGLDKAQFDAFTQLYKKEGLDKIIPWQCQTRADIVTEDWARKAKEANCVLVQLGLEHGIENYRIKIYNKRITNNSFINAANYLRKQGIIYNFNLIIGGPGENRKDILASIKFAYLLKPIYLRINMFILLPQTDIESKIKKETFLQRNITRGALSWIYMNRISTFQIYTIRLFLFLERALRMFIIGLRVGGAYFLIKFFIRLLRFSKRKKLWVFFFLLVAIECVIVEEIIKKKRMNSNKAWSPQII